MLRRLYVNESAISRWSKSGASGMAVQEFGIPTGFEADLESFDGVYVIKRTETENRKVVLYFDSVSVLYLTHLSLASLLWDIGKQHSPRCDAAERGVPSGAVLFAQRNFIEK